jgi:hypothetical protein
MPISKALGKFAAKVAQRDKSGSVRKTVEEQSMMEGMVRMKKADLEDVAKTGSTDEKYYAKQELKRRSEGVRAPSSDSRRDTIQKEIDRYSDGAGNKRTPGIDDDEIRKGGMAKKKVAAKKPAAKKPAVKKPIKKGK